MTPLPQVAEVVAEGSLRAELSQRLQQLQTRLSALDLENEEVGGGQLWGQVGPGSPVKIGWGWQGAGGRG